MKANIETWNEIASTYTDWIKEGDVGKVLYSTLLNALFNSLGDLKGKTVLDLGCGDGILSKVFRGQNANVFAIDGSSKMIDIAKANAKNENIDFRVGDISEKLPYEDESFDVVVCNMVLMYCENVFEIITEVSRILKPNGKFIFSVVHPCFTGEWESTSKGEPSLVFKNNYNEKYKYEKKLGNSFDKPCLYINRPIQDYMTTLIKNKFSIIDFIETNISKDNLENEAISFPLRYNFSSNHLVISSAKS